MFKKTPASRSAGYPPVGLYHFLRENGENKKHLHLRMEADGNGVLIINASRVYHFNPTAACMAFFILNEMDDEQAVERILSLFEVQYEMASSDFKDFKFSLEKIISPFEDPCPVCDLDVDTFMPFSKTPSAPYRMDLALTYRCNNRCVHCYNDPSRAKQELSTDGWKKVLEIVWLLGIPHVVFTGGEPTLRADLPELITFAEQLGLVTGLNTNGRRLSDTAFTERLVSSGLDHVQITLESHDADIHDRIVCSKGAWDQTTAGIRNALETKLFVMTNTTMLKDNSPFLAETLAYLDEIGVPTVGLNGLIYSGRGTSTDQGITEEELAILLETAKTHAAASGQRLIWYTPTMYCRFNPIESGLGVKGCTAALYNMCVEPDATVIPCQSYYQGLGNILEDAWENIWEHDLAVSIRNRAYAPEECHYCDLMDTCGGGCPLFVQENAQIKPHPVNALPF